MMRIPLLFIFILSFYFTSIPAVGKKRCKALLVKLHSIQAMQRNGYSAKRGFSLRNREDNARDNWWQCEQGKGKKLKKVSSKKGHYKTKSLSISKRKIIAGTPFKTNNAIVIKSKYQGDKKRAWLKYYQQPMTCQQPKSLTVFARCSENKQTQRASFEQEYKS